MVCKKCKAQIAEGAKFCPACGAPVEEVAAAPAQPAATEAASAPATAPVTAEKNNICALIGFILSIVSVCCCGTSSLVALILSIVGLNQIKSGNGKGKGLATAGIILSVIGLLLAIVLGILSAIGQINTSDMY